MSAVSFQLGSTPLLQVKIVDNGAAVDISGATTKNIILTDPSGNSSDNTADFATDGSDGVIEFQCVAGTLDEVGRWKIQGECDDSTTFWKGLVDTFFVAKNADG